MGTVATVVSALGGAGAIFAGLIRVTSAIMRVIAESRELRKAVSDNTSATNDLATKFTASTEETAKTLAAHNSMLADHEQRIITLEGRPHA